MPMPESVTLDDYFAVALTRGACDGARVGKFDRVRDQVDDHLDQPVLVAGDVGKVRLDVANERSASWLRTAMRLPRWRGR